MPQVESHGVRIHYESQGSGPALVLAHGAGGNALSWWQQVPFFARRHRVVRFDHRGFGRSHCAPEQLDPALFPDDLVAILDACGVERAALVCQSMGGWTGLGAAVRWPERVACLVLCGTPGGIVTEKVLESQRRVGERVRAEGVISQVALSPGFVARDPERAFLYDQITALNPALDPRVLARLMQTRVEPGQLAGYRVPTLLLACEHDVLFPPAVIHDVAAQLPGAEVHDFAGVGHSSYFEDPARFNRVVAEFVERRAPGFAPRAS